MQKRSQIRNRQADDNGQAIIIVLVVSVLVMAAIGIALTTVRAGLSESITFKAGAQGEMAAQTGLATELTAMRNTSSYTALPCSLSGSLSVPGATSTYSVTVAYSANGTALSCTGSGSTLGGSTTPTNATLTSTGKARGGSRAIMKQDVTIAVSTSTNSALGYAIFTSNNLDLEGAATLNTGVAVPDIYAGEQLTCANGTVSQGSVITYYPVDLTGNCQFSGNLTSASDVELDNSVGIRGNVISYGGNTASTSCDSVNIGTKKNPVYYYYSLCLSGSATIGGTATETNGNIEVPDGTITGNAYASGSISVSGGGTITGTQTPNDTSLSSLTMPAPDSFPVLNMPTTGWSVVTIPTSQCGTYFQNNTDESSGGVVSDPDPFEFALENQTQKTIYEAPNCSVAYSRAQIIALNYSPGSGGGVGDAILEVASLSSHGTTWCEESATDSHKCSTATTPGPNLILYAGPPQPTACTTSTLEATFDSTNNFEPNITTLVYSPGEVDYANAPSMTGQILACGGVTGTNAFTLTFNPSAAYDVFGPPGSSVTITTIDKYIVSG